MRLLLINASILFNCSYYERKQLSIIPESRINQQAAAAYENFRSKTKLITTGSQLNEIRDIGKKMELAVSTFFLNEGKRRSYEKFWLGLLVS